MALKRLKLFMTVFDFTKTYQNIKLKQAVE